MRASLKILGIISAVILVGALIVVNSTTARVDLFFIDGEIAVFLIIAGSFLFGFLSCLVFMWLRRTLGENSKPKRSIESKMTDLDLFREI